MMKLGIATRLDTSPARAIFRKALGYLLPMAEMEVLFVEKSIQELEEDVREELFGGLEALERGGSKIVYASLEDFDCEVILTIGGDGTILRTIHRTNKRVLPINAGILGFLTELEKDDLELGLGKLLDGDYFIDTRSRLRTSYQDKQLIDAVNEVVVHTAQVAKIRSFKIFVDGMEADTIRADGVIVATPTGSTCYAMSAGSPLLDPKVPAFTIVPISSFTLSTRPIVVPDSSEIEIVPLDGKKSLLVIDGQQTVETDGKDPIRITRSERKAEFIRFESNFYKRVWKKLIKSTK